MGHDVRQRGKHFSVGVEFSNFALKKKEIKKSLRKSGIKAVWEQIDGIEVVYIDDGHNNKYLLRTYIHCSIPAAERQVIASVRGYYNLLREITYHETQFDDIVIYPNMSYEKLG